MSLLNKASLIQIPSGYKDGTLYSAKPTNGDGDFTFSRGSNLAATRVNSDGLIEKGRENLALQGSDISTQSGSWFSNQGGITTQNATTSPIGTNTASQITANGTNTYSGVRDTGIAMGALRYTYSVYLKAQSGTPDIRLTCFDGVTFHQQDFAITTEWERYSITFTPSAGTNNIYITSTQAVSWYAWGAQFELGLVSTPYIETGASTAQAGILEDMPRLDYSGGATCPSLLLEPQRTNLITQSEYFNTTPYSKVNATVTTNDITSPEGQINATKLISTSGASRVETFPTLIDNTNYTASIFAKRGDVNYIMVNFKEKSGNQHNVYFDLANGTKGTTNGSPISSSIEAVGDYYRVSITIDSSSGGTTPRLQYLIANTDNNVVTSSGEYIYVYGAMLEAGSYPTSYIPTYGASVTRSADAASDSNVTPTSNKATLYIEINGNDDAENRNVCGFRNGATNQYVLYFWGADNNKFGFNSWAGDSYGITNSTIFNGDLHKIAAVFDFTDFTQNVLFIDGVKQSISQVKGTTVQRTASKVSLIAPNSNQNPIQNIHKFICFDSGLSDDECIQLTTI